MQIADAISIAIHSACRTAGTDSSMYRYSASCCADHHFCHELVQYRKYVSNRRAPHPGYDDNKSTKHAMLVVWGDGWSSSCVPAPGMQVDEEGDYAKKTLSLRPKSDPRLKTCRWRWDESGEMLSRPSLSWFTLDRPRKMAGLNLEKNGSKD